MTDILSTTLGHHQLELHIQLRKMSISGYSLYSLDIFLDDLELYQWGEGKRTLSSRKMIQLFRQALHLLDQWCYQNPSSYLSCYCSNIWYFYRSLYRWGIRADGRFDTWFTFINRSGHRILYPGVLNPIHDCLDVDDLWRVAKDTEYFLGPLETPVDLLGRALNQVGLRNLLESGYVIEQDLHALFWTYIRFFEENKTPVIDFPQHSLGSLSSTNVVLFQPQNQSENVECRFYAGARLLASLLPQKFIIFNTALSHLDSMSYQDQVTYISGELLALHPLQGRPIDI